MFREMLHSADHLVSSDGAWWILGINGILFIPAIFAMFFYPVEVLASVGGLLALTFAALFARRLFTRKQV